MKKSLCLAWGAVLVSVAALAAAEDDDSLRPKENLNQWKWVMDVPLPKKGPGELYDFLAPPAVLTRSQRSDGDGVRYDRPGSKPVPVKEEKRPVAGMTPADYFPSDLGDLRLIDARGREVPYALRVRRAIDARERLNGTLSKPISDAQHQVSATLDLGDNARHNSIQILTSGQNFRRQARIEGRDEKTGWTPLLSPVELLQFQAGNQSLVQNSFDYPESRLRSVRVTVAPDLGNSNDRPELNDVAVFRTVQVKPLEVSYPVELGPREAVRTELGPGSAWVLDLGALAPIDRVTINAREDEFSRQVQLQQITQDNTYQPLVLQSASTVVSWRRGAREQREPLELRFSEVWASKLRLIVTDSRNQPLSLIDPQAFGVARQVIFPAGDARHHITHWEGPLKLYVGKPEAEVPNYSDFTATLPVELKPPPVRIDLKEAMIEKNPAYEPPPLSLTERYPWLVYVVLGAACLALLGVLALLAQRALREAPRTEAKTPAASEVR